MVQLTKEIAKKIRTILGVTAIDGTADSIAIGGYDVTFFDVSGNIWINPNAVAVANTTAFKLVAGESITIYVNGTLSIISDVTGGTYQYIIWEQ